MPKPADIFSSTGLTAPLPSGEGPGVGERGVASRPAIGRGCTPTQPPPQGGGAREVVGFSSSVSGEVYFDHQGRHDTVRVGEDIVVPVADDMVAVRLDHSGTGIVGAAVSVLAPVKFDDKFQSAAREIHDCVSNRKLAREFDAKLFASQPRPHSFFRFRRIFAQFARQRRQAFIAHTLYTPTQPSPSRGRALDSEVRQNAQTH